jgi:hypothetical protein
MLLIGHATMIEGPKIINYHYLLPKRITRSAVIGALQRLATKVSLTDI